MPCVQANLIHSGNGTYTRQRPDPFRTRRAELTRARVAVTDLGNMSALVDKPPALNLGDVLQRLESSDVPWVDSAVSSRRQH